MCSTFAGHGVGGPSYLWPAPACAPPTSACCWGSSLLSAVRGLGAPPDEPSPLIARYSMQKLNTKTPLSTVKKLYLGKRDSFWKSQVESWFHINLVQG